MHDTGIELLRPYGEFYQGIDLKELRKNFNQSFREIAAALGRAHGGLPKLIGYEDLRGDLQVQTDWTDGSDSIEAMAKAAILRGLTYIAITDHTKRLAMTHGLDEKRILQQMAEIDRLNKKFAGKIYIARIGK